MRFFFPIRFRFVHCMFQFQCTTHYAQSDAPRINRSVELNAKLKILSVISQSFCFLKFLNNIRFSRNKRNSSGSRHSLRMRRSEELNLKREFNSSNIIRRQRNRGSFLILFKVGCFRKSRSRCMMGQAFLFRVIIYLQF